MSNNNQGRGFLQISDEAGVFEDARTILSRWREIDISDGSPEPGDIQPVIEDARDKSSWPDEASSAAARKLIDRKIQLPWRHGDKFGERFQVTGLRAGGFGVVFIVESSGAEGKRQYAAKTLQSFLKPDYLNFPVHQQEQIAKAFLEEALPWLQMGQHAHIVPVRLLDNILHPEFERNIPFIFSEYMPRGSLREYLREKRKPDVKKCLSLGIQLCSGLMHAYEHGLTAPMDLKPENIMVNADGVFRVTDFSAAVIGTPGYMAPEQVAMHWKNRGVDLDYSDELIDQRADQFAVSLLILEAFIDRHPFSICREAFYQKDRARQYVSEGVSDFRAWKLSGALRESLSKTLSTIADMRYEEVADFRAELVRIYEKEFGKYAEPEVEIDDSAEWWFDRGRSFRKLGRETFAELPYNEALNRFRNSPGTEVYQANCIQDLGDVYCKTHRYHEAERSYNEAFAVYRRIPGMEVMQATCRRDLGDVYLKTHRYTKAMRSYRKSLSVFPRMREMEKGQAESKMVLGNICSITYSNEAETIHKEFLAEQRRFMRMDEYKDFAYAEAERCYRKLQVLHRRIAGQEVEQASCKMNLGNVYCRAGRYTEAKRSYLEALEEYRRIPGMELEQATCMRELGEVYCGKHRYTEAERCYHEALGRYRRIPGTEMEQAICRKGLGAIYESTHRYTEAVRSYHDALVEYRRIPGTERWQAHCASNLSVLCFFDLPNYAEARRYAEEALKLCKPFPPKTTKEIRSTCWEILEELNRKIKAAHSATKLSESAFEILNYSLARRMAEWAIKICEPFPSEGTEEIRAACERILQGIKKMDTICSRHILPGH